MEFKTGRCEEPESGPKQLKATESRSYLGAEELQGGSQGSPRGREETGAARPGRSSKGAQDGLGAALHALDSHLQAPSSSVLTPSVQDNNLFLGVA